jgi:hypothetical protein
MREDLKHEIRFIPAFDKRDPRPNKNYGIHGANLAFYLSNGKQAVQFVLYTNWHLPHIREEAKKDPKHIAAKMAYPFEYWMMPQPADVGYHSPVPQYEGQEPLTEDCEFTGGTCYYDGSGLQAEGLFELLIAKGSDGLWEELERRYAELFEKA